MLQIVKGDWGGAMDQIGTGEWGGGMDQMVTAEEGGAMDQIVTGEEGGAADCIAPGDWEGAMLRIVTRDWEGAMDRVAPGGMAGVNGIVMRAWGGGGQRNKSRRRIGRARWIELFPTLMFFSAYRQCLKNIRWGRLQFS